MNCENTFIKTGLSKGEDPMGKGGRSTGDGGLRQTGQVARAVSKGPGSPDHHH